MKESSSTCACAGLVAVESRANHTLTTSHVTRKIQSTFACACAGLVAFDSSALIIHNESCHTCEWVMFHLCVCRARGIGFESLRYWRSCACWGVDFDVYTYMYTYIYIYTHTCWGVNLDKYAHMYICICIYIYMYKSICIYTSTHIYIHV